MATVSVVVPTYNRADVLPRAIESVLQQTYEDFELIIVDDGSTDTTKEVVQSYDDERIRYVPLKTNNGANAARNTGIRQANGRYISFLDSDDEFRRGYLKECISKFQDEQESIGGVFTSYYMYNGGLLTDISLATSERVTFDDIVEQNVIGGFSCITVRSQVFESVGFLDEELKSTQDYDFYIRLLKKYDAIGIKEPLVNYHYTSDSISTNINKKIKGQKQIETKYGDILSQKRLASHHQSRGKLYMQEGVRTCGILEFKKAILLNPRNLINYYYFCSAIGGKSAFKFGFQIKEKIKRVLYILRAEGGSRTAWLSRN